MSYQIMCDNCHVMIPMSRDDTRYERLPPNWEVVPFSAPHSKPVQHLCFECVKAKDAARYAAQEKIRAAEEAALATRRPSSVERVK